MSFASVAWRAFKVREKSTDPSNSILAWHCNANPFAVLEDSHSTEPFVDLRILGFPPVQAVSPSVVSNRRLSGPARISLPLLRILSGRPVTANRTCLPRQPTVRPLMLIGVYGAVTSSLIPIVESSHLRRECLQISLSPASSRRRGAIISDSLSWCGSWPGIRTTRLPR